jgi:Gnt-I system high-affinity gluconate transporter
MSFVIVIGCIIVLILLITWGKLNAFLAFLLVSILAGLLLKLPFNKIMASMQKGMGDTLGSLVIIIALGAMLGKLVAESGAAQKIARVLMQAFGPQICAMGTDADRFYHWYPVVLWGRLCADGATDLLRNYMSINCRLYMWGCPCWPLYRLPMVFLPPHPSPTALVGQFHASMGLHCLYGLIIAVPAIIIAGPLFSQFIKKGTCRTFANFPAQTIGGSTAAGHSDQFITSRCCRYVC